MSSIFDHAGMGSCSRALHCYASYVVCAAAELSNVFVCIFGLASCNRGAQSPVLVGHHHSHQVPTMSKHAMGTCNQNWMPV
eukprot:SAG11_NODE_11681_length_744_cov_3.924031_1_plen_80_part_10